MAQLATKGSAVVAGNDVLRSLARAPSAMLGAALVLILAVAALLAPWLASQDPFDPAGHDLMDAFTPPVWTAEGQARFPLGTDAQGRDLVSAILHGLRLSLLIGLAAVLVSAALGTAIGILAGYRGGLVDALAMRAADIQLTFPGLLLALLLSGAARGFLPQEGPAPISAVVLVLAIGLAEWPKFARLARAATLVQRDQDYVAAARLIGVPGWRIMAGHLLPNVLGPILVLATIGLPLAVVAEATLSFLGVGLPPTAPSLGTLIRIGNDFTMSGEWWIAAFPAAVLVVLVLAVNLVGDWLRESLDPKLR